MNDIQAQVAELLKTRVGEPPQPVTVRAVRRERARRQLIASLGAAIATVALVVAGVGAFAYWAPRAGPGQPGTGQPLAGTLDGVAAVSATDAWAVGYVQLPSKSSWNDRPLIVHWDGSSWRQVQAPTIPNPEGFGELQSVAATSPDDVWAVGDTMSRAGYQPLIMHWNGHQWRLMHLVAKSPYTLQSVTATSARNAWAVGALSGHVQSAVMLHWNGSTWRQVPTGLAPGSLVGSVAAVTARDAWAVGVSYHYHVSDDTDVLLHWNGTAWARTPDPAFIQAMNVAAVSSRAAWAVGSGWAPGVGVGRGVRMIGWNGRTWQPEPGLSLAPGVQLTAVGASSASNVWAAGTVWGIDGRKWDGVLVVHWNGSRWSQREIAGLSGSSNLYGLSVVSADDAWAVGNLAGLTPEIFHWNGTSWSRAYGSATTGHLIQGSCGPFQSCGDHSR
jgi:hypothetical protein